MKVILFDFDGTLVDTQHLYNIAVSDVLSKINPIYTLDFCTNFFDGKCWSDAFNILSTKESFDKTKVFDDGLALAHELISKQAKPTKGTVQALEFLQNSKINYAICSNSHTKEIHSVLDLTGLRKFFDGKRIFGREMVERGKPESDIYLLGMKEFGASPQNCIAIEDSLNGAKASMGAGIETIIFAGGTGFLGMKKFYNAFGENIAYVENMYDIFEKSLTNQFPT